MEVLRTSAHKKQGGCFSTWAVSFIIKVNSFFPWKQLKLRLRNKPWSCYLLRRHFGVDSLIWFRDKALLWTLTQSFSRWVFQWAVAVRERLYNNMCIVFYKTMMDEEYMHPQLIWDSSQHGLSSIRYYHWLITARLGSISKLLFFALFMWSSSNIISRSFSFGYQHCTASGSFEHSLLKCNVCILRA